MRLRHVAGRIGLGLLLSASLPAQPVDPSLFSDLRWRLVGPFRGGWATCVAGVPQQPRTYYFGAAGGGVWKSEDAGRTWNPIFDHESTASIGAVAVAPSDPNVIYVGTGQIQMRYDLSSGDGVYRSDDSGKSWIHAGLSATRAIGRIWVDPRDARVALVAALGHVYGPNHERGVFRTEDGGKSWTQTLFVDENTGAADLAADPENSAVVYASAWQARNYPWLSYFEPAVGPGSGVYKSENGGRTWKRISGGGWPAGDLGRIGLAAAPGGRVWALVDAADRRATAASPAGLYRSDDGGSSWTRINATQGLASSYMNRVTVDPSNRDVVYVTGQSIRRSEDGGATFRFFKGAPGGDDYHFVWINPSHPELMATASDQGTVVSENGGTTWSSWYNQPTGQFYHAETDSRFPYRIYSGQQDSGTVGIASRGVDGAVTDRDWHPVGGEERGWDVPDPADPRIVYGTGLGGNVTRYDARTGQVRNISPAVESAYGRRPTQVRYRYSWISPLAVSPRPPHALYFGAQYLFRSTDSGQSWQTISPDLSGAEPGATGCEGSVSTQKARSCGFGVIFSLALSPADEREIWVGTDDGLIRLTRDGGRSWQNVTPRALPEWSKIASLDVSRLDPGTAYAAVDRHRLDDFSPHVLRTHDFGRTWDDASVGIPATRFVTVVRADPERRGLLYAGTDGGVFVSFDDGNHWQSLQLDLPTSWVGDLAVHGDDLVAATQGRALWVLDDLTQLRQITARLAAEAAHLFAPAAAVRVRPNENRDTPLPPEEPIGQNPPPGAIIDYWLAPGARGPVRLEIRDAAGGLVRAFSSDQPPEHAGARRYFTDLWARPPAPPSTAPGHHRIVWDLRYPPPPAARYEYKIAAVRGEDTPAEPQGPLALPGRYTVRLTAAGKSLEQPLVLKADPRVETPPDALESAFRLERAALEAMRVSFDALEEVKRLRKRLETLKSRGAPAPIPSAVEELDRKAAAFEGAEENDGSGPEGFARLNGRFASILTAVGSADLPPTDVQRTGLEETHAKLEERRVRWKDLLAGDAAALDTKLEAAGLPPIAGGRRAR